MLKKLALQFCITLVSLLVVLVMFEYYLRETTTHFIRQGIKQSGGVFEATAEKLVDFSSGKRRFVPGAKVLIKNHYFSGLDVMMDINSIGFRDDEVKPTKAPNEFRILGLGDSITVQDYLPKNQTYLDLLEQKLNKQSSSQRYNVINSAIGNIGLLEEIAILEDDGLSTQPDLVLLALYLNDTRPPWGFSGETGDKGWLRKHSLLVETILKNIEEKKWADENKKEIRFGWIKDKESLDWKNSSSDFQKLINAAQYDWGHAWQEDAEAILEKLFEQLAQLSKAHGFRVAVIHFPVTFQIDARDSLDTPQRFAATLSKKYNFSHLDLLPVLKGNNSEELYYDHCHPNAEGSKIIARSIEQFLQQSGMLSLKESEG